MSGEGMTVGEFIDAGEVKGRMPTMAIACVIVALAMFVVPALGVAGFIASLLGVLFGCDVSADAVAGFFDFLGVVMFVATAALAVASAVSAVRFGRGIPSNDEVRRRMLLVITGSGCMVITRSTPMANIKMRIRRRGSCVLVTSNNVYLQEFHIDSSPELLKALGAQSAFMGDDDELCLVYGRLSKAYEGAERRYGKSNRFRA